MDWLQFIASMVGSLAWPIAVVMLVVLLRTQIKSLLTTLTSLKYKDLEMDFGRELKKAEEKAREVIDVHPKLEHPRPTSEKPDSAQLLDEAERLKDDFPEPAVAVAWSAVEDELMTTVMRLAVSPDYPPHKSALKNAQFLEDAGAVRKNTIDLVKRMRNLRNLAVHGTIKSGFGPGPVTTDEARQFIALARGLVAELRKAKYVSPKGNGDSSKDAKVDL